MVNEKSTLRVAFSNPRSGYLLFLFGIDAKYSANWACFAIFVIDSKL
jgi:hypothetical protein